MATGQNNNFPNDPNNQNRGRRPSGGVRREKVPGAVKAIYIMAALLILAICALIFVVTLKATGWNGTNQNDSSGAVITPSDDSDSSIDLSGAGDSGSGDSSDTHDVSFTSSEESSSDVTSYEVISSAPQSSDPESSSEDWSNTVTAGLPEDYADALFADDLFIGDSIFTGLHLYGYLDVKNVAAAVGYTPYKALHSAFSQGSTKSAKDYAVDMQPKRIFIMLGSNAMGAGTNYDTVVSQYKDLVSALKSGCPDSFICVISVPPVTKNSSTAASAKISNDDIDSMNVKLKSMAKDLGVEYFDLNSMLSDDNGYFMEEYAEMDGLHFLGRTYKVLLSALQREVIE